MEKMPSDISPTLTLRYKKLSVRFYCRIFPLVELLDQATRWDPCMHYVTICGMSKLSSPRLSFLI